MIEKRETRRVAGFNSIFAAASIPMAIRYYNEFKKQIAEKNRNLTIATIFSFSANEEEPDGLLPEEDFNMENLDQRAPEIFLRRLSEITIPHLAQITILPRISSRIIIKTSLFV